jgi:N-dimethylarginine dimethylaminohydrolase
MKPRFLLCPPDFYDAHYLFNPHMRYTERVSFWKARRQWRRLVRTLEAAGAELEFLEPEPVTTALPFTADGAFCYEPGRALVLKNDGVRGDVEPIVFTRRLSELGYVVETTPPRYRLDGGNLLRVDAGTVLAGLKPGATGLGERYLAKLLARTTGARVVGVPLVDPAFLHLDMAIGVLGGGRYLVYRDALGGGELPEPLRSAEVVEVDRADALRFACNAVVIGDVVVTGPVSTGLERRLGRLGLHVERVDLSEFYKAGGGAKCLTLPLA